MKMTEREHYDKEEDRANDKKSHDNPKHPSEHANEVALQEAKDKEKENK
jgi:hypothetical protein